MSDLTVIPFSQLHLSSRNVRSTPTSKAALAALAANIKAIGVQQNLVVEASDEVEGHFGVIAGGRRWRAVQSLVEAGELPADYPMPCRVQTAGIAAESSLAENYFREAMHPADEYAAFTAMIAQGLDENAIALHFGCDVKQVRQRMKLAAVHPTILKAFRRGDIDEQAVMAFTLADTKKLQLAVFKELGNGRQCSAWAIRRAITQDGERSDSALSKFVGVSAYAKAGGRMHADLFAGVSYLSDRDILIDLATKKLDAVATTLREREGWQTVDVSVGGNNERYRFHRREPAPVGVPGALLAEQSALEAELQALEDTNEDWTEEREAAYQRIDGRLDAIATEIDDYRQYSDEDKAQCVCFVHVGQDGKAEVLRGYVSPQIKAKAEKQARADAGEASAVLSRALLDVLGTHRQQIAKAKLASEPKLALDVLLYSLASQLLKRGYVPCPLDASFREVGPDLADGGEHAQSAAGVALIAARAGLSLDWLALGSEAAQFAALRALPAKAKQALFAYCAAASLQCGVKRDDGIAEAVLADLAPDYAAQWRPTAENYFSRIPREQLLQHGREWFGGHWASEHAHSKKKALVAHMDQFFSLPVADDASEALKEVHAIWMPEAFGMESR